MTDKATQETEQGTGTDVGLDDALKAAWEASEAPEENTEGETPEETADTSQEAGGGSDEPDDKGSESEESTDSEDESGTQDEQPEEEEESVTPTVEAPSDWPKDWQEKFATLESDDHRQLLIDQYKSFQADYTRKTQDIADLKKAIPEDVKQSLDLRGISEGQYLKSLSAADQYLSKNPVEGIQWLMKSYGVNPEQIAGTSEDEYSDPEVSRLKQEIRELKQTQQQQTQQQQQASEQDLNQRIQSFATETDEKGHLKHPDFEKLKPAMGGLLQSGYAQTLEDAYEQARWADPEVREKLLAEQQRQASQESEKQRKEKAAKAKQASTPASTGTTGGEKEQPADLRSELEKQFDQT